MAKYKKTTYTFKSEDDLITFGKVHNGEKIGDVMRKDPQYIDFCVEKFKGFKLYKKLAERYEEIKKESKENE